MWARIENGTVVEITDVDPTERFHPDLMWRACSKDVRPDWILMDSEFSQPLAVSPSEQDDTERVWRNIELQSTEWLATRHRDEQDIGQGTTLTAAQYSELLGYRQRLRDWPQTSTFPNAELRPIAPRWIAEQSQ
ncbi:MULTISPECIES: phage tail assembly chaperone [unclassified Pseudomonas]|uniref:phage tail assembly chaperone n=1 Tax=unclassified Pseudomonas TaxID=196821 RepID=UPI000B8045D7|nr:MULTISPECIES: phage tail assembly chaperone [unclassified Pseudomonas]